MTMKPGDTVITPEGKEGIVWAILPSLITRDLFPISHVTTCPIRSIKIHRESLVYVDFSKPNKHWKVFLESDLKVKEEINENTNRTSSQRD